MLYCTFEAWVRDVRTWSGGKPGEQGAVVLAFLGGFLSHLSHAPHVRVPLTLQELAATFTSLLLGFIVT